MPETVNMLSGLSTLEISNVKRAANRKKYATTKAADATTSQETTVPIDIQKALSVAAEGEPEYVATLKSAGKAEDEIKVLTAQYRLSKNFADVLPPAGAVTKAAKPADEDDLDQQDGETDKAYASRMKKAAKAKKTAKSADVEDEPAEDPRLEAVMKSNATLAKTVESLSTGNRANEFRLEARTQYRYVGKSEDDIVAMLEQGHQAGTLEITRKSMKALSDMNASNPAFKELGFVGKSDGTKHEPYEELAKLADSVTMKSADGSELSEAQKMNRVLKTAQGRVLYSEYLAQNPAQRALTADEQRYQAGLIRQA